MKLEVDDLALVARERLENLQDPPERLACVVRFVEVVDDGCLSVLEGRGPRGPLSRIERQIPAHGEQPGRQMSVNPRLILPAQPQEGLLHDVSRGLQIPEQPLRIANQWPLVPVQRVDHPFGVRCPAHSGSCRR